MTKLWIWVAPEVALAVHDRQLSEHGGGEGVRDAGLLSSALARPENLAAYGEPDAADLAAAYVYGIARNHPFVDGNKRTAWVIARVFLALNDWRVHFLPAEAVATMEALAAGMLDESGLAEWFRERISGR